MKVRTYSLAVVLAAFSVAAAPALAQSPREGGSPTGGGSERAGGGGSGNSGNAGGGGGGGAVATGGGGGGGGSSTSSSGASFSSPSGFSATSPNISFGERSVRTTAPQRRSEFAGWASTSASSDGQARPRAAGGSGGSGGSSGSGGSGERAVPRGERATGDRTATGRDTSSAGTSGGRTRMTPTNESDANNSAGAREVPSWSRPRGDRPVTGVAVERTGPPPSRDSSYRGGRFYDPYYYYGYPYYFGGYGLYSGYGLYGFNPYFGDLWDPYYSGYGGGYGGYGGFGGYSSGVYNTREQGNLKLKVKPRNAKVYVDGFFVGLVDEFDGAFQKLALNGGRHKVEVRADGYETAEFDVLITPDQTVTFQGELKKIQ